MPTTWVSWSHVQYKRACMHIIGMQHKAYEDDLLMLHVHNGVLIHWELNECCMGASWWLMRGWEEALWDKDQVLGLLACMHACMQCSRIDVRDATGTTMPNRYGIMPLTHWFCKGLPLTIQFSNTVGVCLCLRGLNETYKMPQICGVCAILEMYEPIWIHENLWKGWTPPNACTSCHFLKFWLISDFCRGA